MRKLSILFLAATFSFLSCKSGEADKAQNSVNTPAETPKLAANNGSTIRLTKQQFIDQIFDYEKNTQEWVYKGNLPGLVDFYADWCRPCKITSPILEELAQEFSGQINIYKVNVDEERELASVFGVQSIPTFLFMPMVGKPTISSGIAQTPEQTKEMFRNQINEILLKK